MSQKVYTDNLPLRAKEPEVRNRVSKAGDVMSIKIVQNRQTGQA